MNLLVTGGCGFIGSNFIRQRLTEKSSPLVRLVNLDALTYAGNPANLADLAGDPRYVFTQGDIGDAALVSRLLAEHAIDAVVNRDLPLIQGLTLAFAALFVLVNLSVDGLVTLANPRLRHG